MKNTRVSMLLGITIFLFLPYLHGQVRLTTISIKDPDEKEASLSFPFIKSSDKRVSDKINGYLQKEMLHNDVIETKADRLFKNSAMTMTDSSIEPGYTIIKYSVGENGPNILSLKFDIENQAATAGHYSEYYNFNVRTGELLQDSDLFTPKGIEQIKKSLIQKRKKLVEQQMIDLRKEFPDGLDDDSTRFREMFADCIREPQENQVFIKKNGIVFYKGDCLGTGNFPYEANLDIEKTFTEIMKYLSKKGETILFQNKLQH